MKLPADLFLSVDAAWRLVRADTWHCQRLTDVVTQLVTGRTTTHDLCSSLVMWSPRKRTGTTGSDARSPPVATTTLEAVVIAGEELLLSVDAAWRLVRADP